MVDGDEKVVFTGDTLFIGGKVHRRHSPLKTIHSWPHFLGCGRFFEGTPAEMHTALNKTLAGLPDDTKVYVNILPFPAHPPSLNFISQC